MTRLDTFPRKASSSGARCRWSRGRQATPCARPARALGRTSARLLAERPEGVEGLAVAGMPLGSPGMEAGNRKQAYQVIAFGKKGRSVFASYPGA